MGPLEQYVQAHNGAMPIPRAVKYLPGMPRYVYVARLMEPVRLLHARCNDNDPVPISYDQLPVEPLRWITLIKDVPFPENLRHHCTPDVFWEVQQYYAWDRVENVIYVCGQLDSTMFQSSYAGTPRPELLHPDTLKFVYDFILGRKS